MFYFMYLTGLCARRQWPAPLFTTYQSHTTGSWHCTVRVNNREYTTETWYHTELLARDAAATQAYLICRNFSANDGMYPGQRPGTGRQGRALAIGADRRAGRDVEMEALCTGWGSASLSTAGSEGSEESSPRSAGSGDGGAVDVICACRRGGVVAYGRCRRCLRDAGWA